MGGEKKRGGKTPDWGGQIFQKFFEGGKTHFSPPFLDPCACMNYDGNNVWLLLLLFQIKNFIELPNGLFNSILKAEVEIACRFFC